MTEGNDIKANVLRQIREGHVSMRSRFYFVVRIIALVILVLFALTPAIFAVSFVAFSVHESGEQILLGFGTRGFSTFFTLFPWIPVATVFVLLLCIEWLLRSFRFGYRISLLRIFGIILAIAVAAGILLDFTPLHSTLLDRSRRGALPVLGPLYQNIRGPHEEAGLFRGMITGIEGRKILISRMHNGTTTVRAIVPPPGFNAGLLHVGDMIFAAGDIVHDTIYAYGLQVLVPGPATGTPPLPPDDDGR